MEMRTKQEGTDEVLGEDEGGECTCENIKTFAVSLDDNNFLT